MKKLLTGLLIAALPVTAQAADLRLYPTFAEVRETVTLSAGGAELSLPRGAWNLTLPGSLSWSGTPLTAIRAEPGETAWLRAREGQGVTLRRAGQPAQPGILVRASDLLVRLETGEHLNATLSELGFPEAPPADWAQGAVRLRLEGGAGRGVLSYRTGALSWRPRYELSASGASAQLSALAEIRNVSAQAYQAQNPDLYAGDVRLAQNALPGNAPMPMQQNAVATSADGVGGGMTSAGVGSLGEVRGLQRYVLRGPLSLSPYETLTVPFLRPQLSAFTRYHRVTSYFDPMTRSGSASRHYKFTPSLSMPTGSVDVREDGALVGSVTLSAAQAGRPVDLDLGLDPELRYTRTVKRLALEKDPSGRILSATHQITFAFTSTKTTSVRVQVREQVYGRFLVVDGQNTATNPVLVERSVQVPAGGKATVGFKVKIGN